MNSLILSQLKIKSGSQTASRILLPGSLLLQSPQKDYLLTILPFRSPSSSDYKRIFSVEAFIVALTVRPH
jgi:hypothetical protein